MNLQTELIFFVNDQIQRVDCTKISPSTTLNTYLRDVIHLTGTKRMCMEGGCGACIVAVNDTRPLHKDEIMAINSCLVTLFWCYGRQIYTIEGVGNSRNIHPLQGVLAKFKGTQCGYCTPGVVMNMYALEGSKKAVSMRDVENSFGGNICRCTGYRPILSAFKSICRDASHDLLGTMPDLEDLKPCRFVSEKKPLKEIPECSQPPFYYLLGGRTWIKPQHFDDLLKILKTFDGATTKMVAGDTAKGVYKEPASEENVFVDVFNVDDLRCHKVRADDLMLGANLTLSEAMGVFCKVAKMHENFGHLEKMARHVDLVANVPVRNIGTLAGNLMIKHKNPEFPSDIFIILETARAKLQIVASDKQEYVIRPSEFLHLKMERKVIKKIILPMLDTSYKYESYKIMTRAQNTHALVNAGFLFKISPKNIVEYASISYGCINERFVHAKNTEVFLLGKQIYNNEVLQEAFQILSQELTCETWLGEPSPVFRKNLAMSLFYKYILSITPKNLITKTHLSGASLIERPISKGAQDFQTNTSLYPVGEHIIKLESIAQVTGEAEYITDKPDLPNQLYAAFVLAKAPPTSRILKIDTKNALSLNGVETFFDRSSIPGKNTFTPFPAPLVVKDEELFCSGTVQYHSQPIGIIVANTHEIAIKAAELVQVEFSKPTRDYFITIRDLLEKGNGEKITKKELLEPKRTGNVVKHVLKGSCDVFWQFPFYMEPQCCSVVPKEDGLEMFPSSQWMDMNQNAAAAVLDIPANKIDVSVKRIGGGFGGKIIRNSLVSTAAALAAYLLRKPVKMWLPIEINMRAIGKRYPLTSFHELATDEEGRIQYLNIDFFYDHGTGGNEAVIELLVSSLYSCYESDTWRTKGSYTNTDTPGNCYVRAPGTVEAMSVIESIMEQIALELDLDPLEVRLRNFRKKELPKMLEYIEEFKEWAEIERRKRDVKDFNKENRWRKRGLSIIPLIYPIELFTCYGVMVSIYHRDGSVAVSHGGVEVGQGINTKAAQTCAYKLGIPLEKITVKSSNNITSPNSSFTGGSITSEGVCWGIMKACDVLLERMEPIKAKMKDPTWEDLAQKCYDEFVNLSATGWNTPKDEGLGNYSVYAICAAEIELDVLTGQSQITRVDLLEDVGDSINPAIDIGQIEGAFVMGLGYFTTERILTDDKGEILTNRTWNYTPPGPKDIPVDFRVKFPGNNPNPVGVLKSKATGEPALSLAVSVPIAIRQAVSSVRQDFCPEAPKWYPFNGPSNVENTFVNCLHDFKKYTL